MTVILVNAEAGRIPLPAGVVHCHCTSPPYWRQRDYSSKKEEEGDTQRRYWPEVTYRPGPGLPEITVPAGVYALGMEPTPELFIAHLVAVYREVYRVTRADSAGWNVIGDCFWDSNRRRATRTVRPLQHGEEDGQLVGIPAMLMKALQADGWYVRNDCVWQKKSPMPESVAGWSWQRHQVKVGRVPADWQKLPKGWDVGLGSHDTGVTKGNYRKEGEREATTPKWADCPGCPRCQSTGGYVLRRGSWRHTRAHETVLHLSKGMGYWSDGEAVREALNCPNAADGTRIFGGNNKHGANIGHGERTTGRLYDSSPSGRNPRSVLSHDDPTRDLFRFIPRQAWVDFLGYWVDEFNQASENPVSLLVPKPSGYAGQHYAVYPPDLIRSLIKSSCPRQCCPACGAGWAAQIKKGDSKAHPSQPQDHLPESGRRINGNRGNRLGDVGQYVAESNVIDYRPTCNCHAGDPDPPHVPGLLLDPFLGSGTSLIEARKLGLNGIGLDLSYPYLHDQARERLGLNAWDAWHEGGDGEEVASLEGLPLFEGVR